MGTSKAHTAAVEDMIHRYFLANPNKDSRDAANDLGYHPARITSSKAWKKLIAARDREIATYLDDRGRDHNITYVDVGMALKIPHMSVAHSKEWRKFRNLVKAQKKVDAANARRRKKTAKKRTTSKPIPESHWEDNPAWAMIIKDHEKYTQPQAPESAAVRIESTLTKIHEVLVQIRERLS